MLPLAYILRPATNSMLEASASFCSSCARCTARSQDPVLAVEDHSSALPYLADFELEGILVDLIRIALERSAPGY